MIESLSCSAGFGQNVVPRLRECYRQSQAEVVSNSTKPGDRLLAEPCKSASSKRWTLGEGQKLSPQTEICVAESADVLRSMEVPKCADRRGRRGGKTNRDDDSLPVCVCKTSEITFSPGEDKRTVSFRQRTLDSLTKLLSLNKLRP